MSEVARDTRVFRIGIYELTAETGELRRDGKPQSRLQAQPLQVLLLLLERPAQVVTRDELREKIWPANTFVDFDHGVNTAINKLRGAFGDSASNSRFIQTLPRVGYRFVAPVEVANGSGAAAGGLTRNQQHTGDQEESLDQQNDIGSWNSAAVAAERPKGLLSHPADLPLASHAVTLGLFVALQVMYLVFYIAALANFSQLQGIATGLTRHTYATFTVIILAAAVGVPLRLYLLSACAFRYRRLGENFLKLFPFLLVLDELWALAPFLIARYIGLGLALAATAALVYAPFAQRSLLLMSSRPKHP
ncbi:MAG TPA: winged helix-turn-helix domain-containing protein [Candidatus Acidoferrum sp.]|nr:winged helix-turn-helix domain-containing protein [Candidatus Acidoferrum sp.]